MKLLNALEDFKARRQHGRPAPRVREGFGILLRCLYPATPHIAHAAVAGARLRQGARATCSTRPGRRSTTAALEQDEIELMLQVNGKLRGSLRVPAGASQAGDREDRARQRGLRQARRRRRAQARDRGARPAGQRGGLKRMTHAPPLRAPRLPGRWPRRLPGARGLRLRAAQGAGLRLQDHCAMPGNSAFVNYAAAQHPRGRHRRAVLPDEQARQGRGDPRHPRREPRERRALDQLGRPGARAAAAPDDALPAAHARAARSCWPRPRSSSSATSPTTKPRRWPRKARRSCCTATCRPTSRSRSLRRLAAVKSTASRCNWPPPSSQPTCRRACRPLYTLHGDEPLLAQEAADAIRAAARTQGYTERSVVHRGRRAFRLERGAGGRRLAEPVRRPADRRDPHPLGQAGQGRQRRAAADRRGRAGQRQHPDAGDAAAAGQGHAHRRLVRGAGEQRRQPADRDRSSAPRCRNGSRSGWRSRASA